MMICKSCQGTIKDATVICSVCNAQLHDECKFQCVQCGAVMCDECALKQKYKCNECRNVEQFKMEFISSTMFEAYEKCPYAFKHEHILKTVSEEQRENKYSAIGTLLHGLFDKYSQIRPLDEDAYAKVGIEFAKGFVKLPISLFENDVNEFMTKGLGTLANWFNEEKDRPLPLYTEKQHFITLPGIDTPIRATIDRINQVDDGEYEVEDYKTGKVYSADMLRHNFQLPIYAMAIKEVYGKYPKSLRLRFPQHTDANGNIQERRFERTSEDVYVCNVKRGGTYSFSISERLEAMARVYDNIKRGEFPLNTSNGHFCENFCSLGKNNMCCGLDTKWDLANKRGY